MNRPQDNFKRRVLAQPDRLVRIGLAVILLFAAVAKWHQLVTSPVSGDGLLDSRWVLLAAVEIELLFALWLLSNFAPRMAHFTALVCFAVFAVISLLKATSGAASCGCFGQVEVNPWHTFLIDIAAIAAIQLTCPPQMERSESIPHFERALQARWVILAWICLGVPAAVAVSMYKPTVLTADGFIVGNGNLVILEPKEWLGEQLPIIPFIKDALNAPGQKGVSLPDRLASGRWIVVLYRHNCVECQRRIPEYKRLALQSMNTTNMRQFAMIEVPQLGIESPKNLLPAMPGVLGRLTDDRDWFVETPVELTLVEGTVTRVDNDRTHATPLTDNGSLQQCLSVNKALDTPSFITKVCKPSSIWNERSVADSRPPAGNVDSTQSVRILGGSARRPQNLRLRCFVGSNTHSVLSPPMSRLAKCRG